MSYLYTEKGIVRIADDGLARAEVQRVYKNDRQEGKSYFQEVITGIYFIYTPRSIYWNKQIRERIDIVVKDHLRGRSWESFLRKEGVEEMVKNYIDLVQTVNDKMSDKLNSDANELIELLINTPMTIKHKISPGAIIKDDENIDRKITIEQTIVIPNAASKKEYYDLALKIAETIKKINDYLKIEQEEKIKEEVMKRMFDSRESNKIQSYPAPTPIPHFPRMVHISPPVQPVILNGEMVAIGEP